VTVPVLLYRGMSEAEYNEAKLNGFFQSDQHRYDNARLRMARRPEVRVRGHRRQVP